MNKETMDIMAALNLMSNSKTAAGDFMIGTQTLADAFKSAFLTGEPLDPLGNGHDYLNQLWEYPPDHIWVDNAEVKTAGVLTIQNYEKLVGYLGFLNGHNWEVTSVVEGVGHYRIKVITDSGLKCFVYDLVRVPAEHGGYELRKGYETMTIFRLHELQSPLKLFNTLCKILDNKTN
jgi:hypothetical protein